MPGIQLPQRRPRAILSDDEDLDDADDAHSLVSSASSASKRARLTRGDDTQISRDSVLPESYRTMPRASPDNFANADVPHADVYHPGSIVRIKLTNFVTYTSAEFHLGPSLNMVIGPNGTGKSTLVCAICLGLGWSPNNLGRAKEVGEFVKHGSPEGEIEVELSAGPAQKGVNPIIRRLIKKDGNKSHWSLNGKNTNQTSIMNLAKSFSIQIDNLCQFLPQDRVVEFAQMHPIDMLASTQKAAAEPYMLEWHNELKELRTKQKDMQSSSQSSKDTLADLKVRQNQTRGEVDRYQEREAHMKKAKLYEKFRPAVKYNDARARYKAAKAHSKAAANDLKDLKQRVQPALEAMKEKEGYAKDIKTAVAKKKRVVLKQEERATKLFGEQQSILDKLTKCENDRKAAIQLEKSRKQQLQKHQEELKRLRRDYDEHPPDYNLEHFQGPLREKRDRKSEVDRMLRTIRGELEEIAGKARPERQKMQALNDRLNGLKSQAGQKMERLKSYSKDTHTAWEWIKANRDKFTGPVYGPALLECSVKDQKHADLLEASLQKMDILGITCTNVNDFKTLQQHLFSRELALTDVVIRTAKQEMNYWRSPCSADQLRSLGLEGYLIDLLEGPEAVLSGLCDSSKLHKTCYSMRDLSEQEFERLQTNRDVSSWVTPRQSVQVIRRAEYGPSAVSTSTRPVRPARFWTDKVDLSAEQEINRQLREVAAEVAEYTEQHRLKKGELDGLAAEQQNLHKDIQNIQKDKDRAQRQYGEWQALPNKIANVEDKIKDLKTRADDVMQTVHENNRKYNSLVLQKGESALEYAHQVASLRNLHQKLVEVQIWQIEAESDLEVLKERNRSINQQLKDADAQLTILQRESEAIKKEAHALSNQYQQIHDSLTDDERELFEEMSGAGLTMEQLDVDIEGLKTRIELIGERNPGIIKQFEKREQDIRNLEHKLETWERQLEESETKITEIRQKWEPELDTLIAKINDAYAHNFERIGCAGQVSVYKDEDFSKWEIRIYVKFREHEELSLLDSHRQSGGERSVSTIFYLMALQTLARSPFRVVDEINQGMDPRNERTVHERMVDIACAEHTSQYFLITPKLLTGLKYHPRMKLHVINSGEYVPGDLHDLNFKNCVEKALTLKGLA
ncbi:P-loop containing nucleoside triphosphate hydrolase protein [Eremomyces bilateralis CBS 781.70]|uniref:Structural maintenance of chromosomes protein 5 n=1 Tax=Eremomyces bilateralis CBS 781.70 TaxID=1392243 RepID=A0A6G1G3M3_9PEZI|nr:P-loop containing nucleoside triphosphate hydrolase protein [Eremomyces bilateralis CBS 781.70]KAF1812653.1 P-loop containing nucleoside triphosphate hydrolase protein [Eremomyces bilateralis CBS 781.70]